MRREGERGKGGRKRGERGGGGGGTYKSRRVVIPDGFGIAKCLQNRVGLDHLIFKVGLASDKGLSLHSQAD